MNYSSNIFTEEPILYYKNIQVLIIFLRRYDHQQDSKILLTTSDIITSEQLLCDEEVHTFTP